MQKSIEEQNIKLKCTSHMDVLKVFRDDANLVFLFSSFQHRFQIFKKLGAKFSDLFLSTEQFQRNLNYITVNLPLDFSGIFSIF